MAALPLSIIFVSLECFQLYFTCITGGTSSLKNMRQIVFYHWDIFPFHSLESDYCNHTKMEHICIEKLGCGDSFLARLPVPLSLIVVIKCAGEMAKARTEGAVGV